MSISERLHFIVCLIKLLECYVPIVIIPYNNNNSNSVTQINRTYKTGYMCPGSQMCAPQSATQYCFMALLGRGNDFVSWRWKFGSS